MLESFSDAGDGCPHQGKYQVLWVSPPELLPILQRKYLFFASQPVPAINRKLEIPPDVLPGKKKRLFAPSPALSYQVAAPFAGLFYPPSTELLANHLLRSETDLGLLGYKAEGKCCCAVLKGPHVGHRTMGFPSWRKPQTVWVWALQGPLASECVAGGTRERCRDSSCGLQSEHTGLKGSRGPQFPFLQPCSNFRQGSRQSLLLEPLWLPWGRIGSAVAGPVPGCSRMHWCPRVLLGGQSSAGGHEGPPTNCLFFQGATSCPGPWGFVSLPAQLPAQLLCFAG